MAIVVNWESSLLMADTQYDASITLFNLLDIYLIKYTNLSKSEIKRLNLNEH